MDLLKLERMLAVYEARSLRKAAKALGLSQPTLSWSIVQLEESLNARLFERGPRGIKPTELCERLVPHARLIFREQDRLLGVVDASSRTQVINFGVHSIFMTPELSNCIADYAERWPGVTLRVREGFSAELIERLLHGELDFACCALPGDTEEGALLHQVSHSALNYSVVARADHPVFAQIAGGGPIGSHPWVEFDIASLGTFPGNTDVQALLDNVGLSVGRRSVRTTSMNLMKLLVMDRGYIGLIADERVADELASGLLRRLPDTRITAAQFGFVSLRDDFEPAAIRALKAMLVDQAFAPLRRIT